MKKQLVYSSIVAALVLTATTGVIISNETGAKSEKQEVAAATTLESEPKKIDGKNETVYAMTDATGAVKNTFIGSTIYTGEESLPFEVSIKYYLDGTEITANELAGKSGHVKIVFGYISTATYQGMKVPFLAVTGVSLDGAKFSNVKVKNGKIISEGESYMLYGYGVAGANSDLGTDFLPEGFEIEADVTNFALGTTYTVLMNDLIGDIDTSKLTSIDELVNSINQLADGMEQLVNGSAELSNGIERLLNGTKELHTGAQTLANGISSAAAGAKELSGGLTTLSGYNAALNNGAEQIFYSILASASETLSSMSPVPITLTPENYSDTLDYMIMTAQSEAVKAKLVQLKTQIATVEYFCNSLATYTDGVAAATSGMAKLSDGLDAISDKAPMLTDGLSQLIEGETQLYEGSVKLQEGLKTFKTSGIDRLVSFANNDLAGFSRKARQMVTAAASYRNFGGSNAETVKFIVKTASVK